MSFLEQIKNHPALLEAKLLGSSGFPLPILNEAIVVPVNAEGTTQLHEFGIKVNGAYGEGNVVVIDPNVEVTDLNLHFNGNSHNTVVLEKPHSLRGQLQFLGNNHLAIICKGSNTIKADFADNSCAMYIGPDSYIGDAYFWIQGSNCSVMMGSDCMLAWSVGLRTSDAHGVIEIASKKIVNIPRSIVIGPHVWLAQDVLIFKGSRVGSGSIVGARSVVTKEIPACCLAGGVPARVFKSGVTWSRQSSPDADHIDYLLKQPYLSDYC